MRSTLLAIILGLCAISCDRSPSTSSVSFSSLAIDFSYAYTSGTPHSPSYRVSGIITNNGKSAIALPVIKCYLPEVRDSVSHCATGILIPPGGSQYFVTGGNGVKEASNVFKVDFLYSNPYLDEDYIRRQIDLRLLMTFEDVTFEPYDHGRGGRIHFRFVNRSGISVAMVQGTIAMFDSDNNLVGCHSFATRSLDGEPAKYEMLSFNKAKDAKKAFIQINTFQEAGTSLPDQVPIPPSSL